MRIIALGSGGVGKTAVFYRLMNESFIEDANPTIEENYRKQVAVDNIIATTDFLDHYGQEEYMPMLEHQLRFASGIFFMYSITSQESFDEVTGKYYEIMKRVKEDVKLPAILIGNKLDLEHQRAVTTEMGQELASKLGVSFYEASAKTGVNVLACLEAIIREIRVVRTPKPTTKIQKRRASVNCLKYATVKFL